MAVRTASAVILRRAANDDRVYLARRHEEMRFLGGVFAFCGGSVDPVDEEIGRRTSDPARGALHSAALREIAEELGVDLQREGPAACVDDAERRALLDQPDRWRQRAHPERFDVLGPPVLRLVTPDFHRIRFDTWFFLATLDDRPDCRPWPEELDEGGWDTPSGWLARWNRGELLLAPPTVLTLRALDGAAPDRIPHALAALQRDVEGPVPQAMHLDPAVRLLPLRTPTLPPARHTNACLVGRDPAYLVDPATPHPDERRRLDLALERAREEGHRVAAILLTHHHPDHIGAVEHVRARHGWPVWAHRRTAEHLDLRIDRTLEHGERLPLGTAPDGAVDWSLLCLHTPGHAPGHLCFLDSRYGALVAGDMVSTLSSILVHPDDGDLGRYMESLEALTRHPVRIVHPAHGPSDARGIRLLQEQLEHRRTREAAVLAAVGEGATTVEEVTATVYTDVPRPMLGYAAASVRSILLYLASRGQIRLDRDHIEVV